jgi:tape measure domain-containing protein
MNVGKMLGEGILESYSLRRLERAMPQITSFLAKHLDVSKQELSRSMSKGALTKAGIDSKVLLDVFQEYANSLNGGLQSSLETTQSGLNDLHNEWFTFTTDVTAKFKPEIMDLFGAMKDGIHLLKDNESGVISFGKAIAELGISLAILKGVGFMGGPMNSFLLGIDAKDMAASTAASTQRSIVAQQTARMVEMERLELQALNYTATASYAAFEKINQAEASFAFQTNLLNTEIGRLEMQLSGLILAEEQVNAQLADTSARMAALAYFNTEAGDTLSLLVQEEGVLIAELQLLEKEIIATTNAMLLQGETATLAGAEMAAAARAAGVSWVTAGGAMTRTAQEAATAMSIAGTEAGDAFVIGAEEAIVAWDAAAASIQANMYAVTSAVTGNAFQNMAMQGMAGRGASMAGIGTGLIRGATGVFIVGMATQVIGEMAGFWAKSRELKIDTNEWDWFKDMLVARNPATSSADFNNLKTIRADRANMLHDELSDQLSKMADMQSNSVLRQYGINTPLRLDPYGHDLYNAVISAQKEANAHGNPTNFEDVFFPKDKTGRRTTDNNYAYDALHRHYDKLPLLADRDESEDRNRMLKYQQGGASGGGEGTGKLVNPKDKITGQRVITYNIEIKEMNGVKEVKVDGGVNTVGNVKDFAENLQRVLFDVVKDSQLHEGQ